jgi:hypothetical protein
MTNDQFIHLERHQMQMHAHATIVQSLKYPETVSRAAVEEARAKIAAFHTLAQFAQKPAHDLED